jgi:hypothetical protein
MGSWRAYLMAAGAPFTHLRYDAIERWLRRQSLDAHQRSWALISPGFPTLNARGRSYALVGVVTMVVTMPLPAPDSYPCEAFAGVGGRDKLPGGAQGRPMANEIVLYLAAPE